MITLNPQLRIDKIKKNGQAPLVIRITKSRNHAYLYLGISMEPKHWDQPKSRVKRSHDNYKYINASISDKYYRLEQIALDLDNQKRFYTAKVVKEIFENKSTDNLIEYAENWVQQRKNEGAISIGTQLKYNSVVAKLSDYCDGIIRIDEFSTEFLKSYEMYLKDELENSINTISSNFSCMRAIINSLIQDRLLKVDDNPFLRYKFKYEDTRRKYLESSQIEAIRGLKLKEGTKLLESKMIFLFCVETGLRIGDALHLKQENYDGKYIHYYSQKTRVHDNLLLTIKAKRIFDNQIVKYGQNSVFVFDFLDSDKHQDELGTLQDQKSCTALINKNLKIIAERSGIGVNLSTHMARHSMATYALSMGVSMESVQAILNHRDIKTTQKYAKVISLQKDNAVRKLNKN